MESFKVRNRKTKELYLVREFLVTAEDHTDVVMSECKTGAMRLLHHRDFFEDYTDAIFTNKELSIDKTTGRIVKGKR